MFPSVRPISPLKGVLRGRNTIHIFRAADKRIAHFGDLGCELSAEQIEQLKKLKELVDAGILTQEEFDAKKREIMGL